MLDMSVFVQLGIILGILSMHVIDVKLFVSELLCVMFVSLYILTLYWHMP